MGKVFPHMFFLTTSHTKNTISEKTNKHTIQLTYPKKLYEHTLFLKVIIITFTHKNNKNNKKTLKQLNLLEMLGEVPQRSKLDVPRIQKRLYLNIN
jgi:hypothetical protein